MTWDEAQSNLGTLFRLRANTLPCAADGGVNRTCLFAPTVLPSLTASTARSPQARQHLLMELLRLQSEGRRCRGWSLLHEAAYRGRVDLLTQLVENGADVNAECGGPAAGLVADSNSGAADGADNGSSSSSSSRGGGGGGHGGGGDDGNDIKSLAAVDADAAEKLKTLRAVSGVCLSMSVCLQTVWLPSN